VVLTWQQDSGKVGVAGMWTRVSPPPRKKQNLPRFSKSSCGSLGSGDTTPNDGRKKRKRGEHQNKRAL